MVVDFVLYDFMVEYGQNLYNFYVYVMLILCKVMLDGLYFVKIWEWNSKELLNVWCVEWVVVCNWVLERVGYCGWVDYCIFEVQCDEVVKKWDYVCVVELVCVLEIYVGLKVKQMVCYKWLLVSWLCEVGIYCRFVLVVVLVWWVRDYFVWDKGSWLSWLECIVVGNDDQFCCDFEVVNWCFDWYQWKMDYWEWCIVFWMEGQICGWQFWFDCWKVVEEEKQCWLKVEYVCKWFQQFVCMMKELENFFSFGGVLCECGLLCICELEGWVWLVQFKQCDCGWGRMCGFFGQRFCCN